MKSHIHSTHKPPKHFSSFLIHAVTRKISSFSRASFKQLSIQSLRAITTGRHFILTQIQCYTSSEEPPKRKTFRYLAELRTNNRELELSVCSRLPVAQFTTPFITHAWESYLNEHSARPFSGIGSQTTARMLLFTWETTRAEYWAGVQTKCGKGRKVAAAERCPHGPSI